MRNLIQSELIIINGGKQELKRIPDWIWGAAVGTATGFYFTRNLGAIYLCAIAGAIIWGAFSVECPKFSVSGKKGNLSLSS